MGISKHDKQALAQLFIDMGVPLVVAMQTVESWSDDGKPQAKRAEDLAKLLNVSVEFATKITKKLGIRDSYTLENTRGKIIRIVTPIIAERYISAGTIPQGDDLSDLADLFDVLISFSDSVSPTGDDKDKANHTARFIAAVEPAIAVIRDNGDDANIQDTIDAIMARANGLAKNLGVDDAVQSGLLKSVTQVFVSCYKTHEGKDSTKIWADCDERLSIIRGLTQFVGDNAGIKVEAAPKEPATKKEGPKPAKETPKAEPKPSNDGQDKTDESDDEDDEFNPMAFFSAGGK